MLIDFRKKFTSTREANTKQRNSIKSLLYDYESDRGRIINSAAVRRLQQKTQVFPLERNAAVRSRLTHSLEVQQVGRFIVQTIFNKLDKLGQLEQFGLNGLERHFESVVEMSCLMHDIGNPPFGHFGEQAINDWFERHVENAFSPQEPSVKLAPDLKTDICHFEGNAQAIRLIHSLLRLNLTYTQVAGVMKYTRCGVEGKPSDSDEFKYLKKKVGYYKSEESYINTLCNELDIKPHHRHPVTYIMEAADDISYCLADLEDAVEKEILDTKQLGQALCEEFSKLLHKFDLKPSKIDMKTITDAAQKAANAEDISRDSQYFIVLRIKFVHPLVEHAVNRFIDNIASIYEGSFDQALLEDKSHEHALSKAFKEVAVKYAFCNKEVELRELQGYRIINGLLDCYKPLLQLPREAFNSVCEQSKTAPLFEKRLFKKLPSKHVRAYQHSIKTTFSDEQEYYYRCRLLQDYISGMTDQFAYDEYRALMVCD
jgi:dGTPase